MKVITKPKIIKKDMTVDVEVENTHSYQLENGMVSHNSVSLLAGVSSGIHYPHSEYYIRRVRVADNSPLLEKVKKAGYKIEKDMYSPNTMVVEFPVKTEHFDRNKEDVTVWEQMNNASDMQRYWADNSVSITVTFKEDEIKDLPYTLEAFEDKLKCVSFLKLDTTAYKQPPYETITEEEYNKLISNIGELNLSEITEEGVGEKYCDSGKCSIN